MSLTTTDNSVSELSSYAYADESIDTVQDTLQESNIPLRTIMARERIAEVSLDKIFSHQAMASSSEGWKKMHVDKDEALRIRAIKERKEYIDYLHNKLAFLSQGSATDETEYSRLREELHLANETIRSMDSIKDVLHFYDAAKKMVTEVELVGCRLLNESEITTPETAELKDQNNRPVRHYRLRKLYTINGKKYLYESDVMVKHPGSVDRNYGSYIGNLEMIDWSLGPEGVGVYSTLANAQQIFLFNNEPIEQNHINGAEHLIRPVVDEAAVRIVGSPEAEQLHVRDIVFTGWADDSQQLGNYLFVGSATLNGIEYDFTANIQNNPNRSFRNNISIFEAHKLSDHLKDKLKKKGYKKISIFKTFQKRRLAKLTNHIEGGFKGTDIFKPDYFAYS